MSTNLLDIVNRYLTSDNISKLANFLGENPQNTGTALNLAVPSLLAGIVRKYSNYPETGNLINLLKKENHDGSVLDNLQSLLNSKEGTSSLLERGAKTLWSIFGENGSNLSNLISNNSGVANKSAHSLLGLALPFVLGSIGKVAKAEGLNTVSQFTSLLNGQTGFLKNALPAGVSNLLGFNNYANTADEDNGIGKLLPWLLLPLLGWIFYKGFTHQEAVVAPNPLPAPKVQIPAPQTAPIVNQVSNFFEDTLPTGYSLRGAREGVEGKLVGFIRDPNAVVDKETWFNMDGITFDTAKATLRPESNVQLNNIVEIMKAYPAVKLKVGGYTDNTGDPVFNKKLSADRATTIKNALIASGINKNRLEAEGYGSDHPVATNDTEEGRQKNRRIDVRVTAK